MIMPSLALIHAMHLFSCSKNECLKWISAILFLIFIKRTNRIGIDLSKSNQDVDMSVLPLIILVLKSNIILMYMI